MLVDGRFNDAETPCDQLSTYQTNSVDVIIVALGDSGLEKFECFSDVNQTVIHYQYSDNVDFILNEIDACNGARDQIVNSFESSYFIMEENVDCKKLLCKDDGQTVYVSS